MTTGTPPGAARTVPVTSGPRLEGKERAGREDHARKLPGPGGYIHAHENELIDISYTQTTGAFPRKRKKRQTKVPQAGRKVRPAAQGFSGPHSPDDATTGRRGGETLL